MMRQIDRHIYVKPRLAFILALLLLSSAAHAEVFKSYTENLIYTFEVDAQEQDQWDPRMQEAPPLAPGKAFKIAEKYVAQVPIDPKMKGGWVCWGGITLKPIGGKNGKKGWIYVFGFFGFAGPGSWNGPVPEFTVPVRMDGTIPEPSIVRR